MTDEEKVRRANDARQFLESPLWQEAWQVYRDRLLSAIESADSNNTEMVMHSKRLLAAGTIARKHLEAIIVEGKMATADIAARKQRK